MKYHAVLKQYKITQDYTLYPDGFGSWTIKNMGNTTLIINNTIRVNSGESIHLQLDSDTVFNSQLACKFDSSGITEPTTKTSEAIIMLTYCKEV